MTGQSFYKTKKYYIKYISWVLEISKAHLSWSFRSLVQRRNLSLPSAEKWGIENRERKRKKDLYTPWSCPDVGVLQLSQVSQHRRSPSIQYNFVHNFVIY